MNPIGTPVVWSAPLLLRTTGFGDSARCAILALDDAGLDVRADPACADSWQVHLTSGSAERLERLLAVDVPERFVHVIETIVQHMGERLHRDPRAARVVARTMSEVDCLPASLVPIYNEVDEVWVASDHDIAAFARAGVKRSSLHKIPESLPAWLYRRPGPPLPLPQARGFVFLSVLAWSRRKGWDVLVRAYLEEFSAGEDVSLVLAVRGDQLPPQRGPRRGAPRRDGAMAGSVASGLGRQRAELDAYLSEELGCEPGEGPPIVLLPLDLTDAEMPSLYRAANAFAMPSRGEGWGRTYMEAMAAGLPTIGTRWGGNLEFMDDENSYLLDCRLEEVPPAVWRDLPHYCGHRWAEPSCPHLRTLMRRVFEERGEARGRARRAQAEVLERCDGRLLAAAVVARMEAMGEPPARRPAPPRRRLEVACEEADELARALVGTGTVDLRLAGEDPPAQAGSGDPALGVLTALPRDLGAPIRVCRGPPFSGADGRLVLRASWKWGPVPLDWVERLNDAAEVWVPTLHVREGFLESGVDPEKVAVVPYGVNPLHFHPHVAPLQLPGGRSVRFLFVGRTLPRNGLDVLLDVFLETFAAEDDVCLVVKGVPRDAGADDLRATLRSLQCGPRGAQVLYLDTHLPPALMPALYAGCHCLVAPYRAEDFGLAIAEAMACGLPVIATGYGACLDYCDPSVACLLPAREVSSADRRVGSWETAAPPRWAEVDRGALAEAMWRVAERPERARELGLRACARVRSELTWARAADAATSRLEALAPPAAPGRQATGAVSVCIIARDEAATIGECIDSVRGLADQVVVVDTGSTDGTAEVARACGAEVHPFAWCDDFAAARNESLRHARHPWILVLDADERLARESHAEVRRLIRSRRLVGYELRLWNYTESQGSAAFVEHFNLRLFPNHPDLRYTGADPHAHLVAGRADLPFTVERCGVIVHHEGYRPQFWEARRKPERNLRALELAVLEEPDEPFHAFNLGRTLALTGRPEEAGRAFRRALQLGAAQLRSNEPPAYLVDALLSLALALFRQRRYAEAADRCAEALALDPHLGDAHVTLGAAKLCLGDTEGAVAAYRRALACDGLPTRAATDRTTTGVKALLGIAEALVLQGDLAGGMAHVERARTLAPSSPAVVTQAARTWLAAGVGEQAERTLCELVANGNAPADAWLLLADHQLERGACEQALETFREAARWYPHEPVFRERLVALGEHAGEHELDERVHRYDVHGTPLILADVSTSTAAAYVVGELLADCYQLATVPLRPGDVVVDIGAHVGGFAIYVASRHPEVTVYAVEPTPQTFAALQRNVARNGVRNVVCLNSAVTADGRDLEMSVRFSYNSGGATANLRRLDLPEHYRFTARSVTLDGLLSELGVERVRLLKIDCEGSEHEILLHARCLERIDYLRGEFHINEQLRAQGYAIERLVAHCAAAIGADRVAHVATKMAE